MAINHTWGKMAGGTLEGYCGSPLWNETLTWNTTEPYFTPCFEQTVLVWTPCAFLWLFATMKTYYLLHSQNRDIPWTVLNIVKPIICVLLILVCLLDLGYVVYQTSNGGTVFSVQYYTPVIKAVTFILALVFILLERRRGIQTSGIMFIFWLLIALCGAVTYRTVLNGALDDDAIEDLFPFVTYMIYYPLVVAQLLLHCWADSEPQYTEDGEKGENPNPEATASFLSKLLFAWFDRMAWRGYRHSLQTKDLWDMNSRDKSRGVVPVWDKYWNKAVKKTLEKTSHDLNTSSTHATFSRTSARVDFINPKKSKKRITSILPVLVHAFGPTFCFGSIMKLLNDLMTFVSPQILRLLIGFVEGNEEMWKGYLYASVLLVTSFLQTIILSQYFLKMYVVGLRIRTSIISAVYRKALHMSPAARKESTVGEIVNLMSVDAQRFMDLTAYLNMLWSAPLQIALALFFLWDTLGPSVLAGVAVMIVLVPINGVIANKSKKLQIKQMKYKDQRVKLMNEILSGIKVLKLYAWEPSFQEQVLNIRNKEVHVLKQAAYLSAGTSFIWTCAPFLVTLASFAMYVLVDETHILTAEKAFVCLSLFNIMRMPMTFLPMLIVFTVQASVSLKRINNYLNSEDLDPTNVSHDKIEENPIVIENGTFTWDPDESPVLKGINLQVKDGSLVAIVGEVGSGKSSLISALFGDTVKLTGRVNTKGSIAYVPQQAWIQNCTVRDNITFGKSYENKFYNQVVDSCALRSDLDILPGGDMTEIGEKGINLSGGQKQRVSLARAVYSCTDMYFLDDPLSAVDSHVGKHIFDHVIGPKGILRKKTRLIVTHGITYLPQMDHIIVLKDGEVSETGTYKELLDKKGNFADFLIEYLQEMGDEDAQTGAEMEEIKQHLEHTMGKEEFQRQWSRQLSRQLSRQKSVSSDSDNCPITASEGSAQDISRTSSHEESPKKTLAGRRKSSALSGSLVENGPKQEIKKKAGEQLIEVEKAETGSVKWGVYLHYLRAVGGWTSLVTVLFYMIYQGFSVGSNIWLSVWSNEKPINNTQDTAKRDMYLGVYGALGVGQAVSIMIATITISVGCLNAGAVMHLISLRRVMRSPMSFYDTTPIGRIINRFAKDVDVMDNTIPFVFRGFIGTFFSVAATLVVISYSTPIFIAIILPLALLYYFVQRFYVCTSRQLKRLESVSRSPIYSHFSESLSGAPTIRAYGQQERFILESEHRVDHNQVCFYPSIVANRWLAVRLETAGNLIIFSAALLSVIGQHSLDPGIVGLSVTYALQVTQTLNWLVRMTSDVETNIVAVERIKEYGQISQEAAWEVPDQKPIAGWPSEGKMKFNSYKTRYREGLDLVLKEITCDIQGGEKVGIVGRTGAGKSSLTLALFRIIEAAEGSISIDEQNISNLGLHDLRSRLTIIPQDPVLFSGLLRMNLDPFNKYSDEEVWRALEHAHLKHFIKGLPAGLNHEVSEGGENLSVGQRQLICLARALLRKTKVLILDEATAAVDLETDDLIQKTIRTEFEHCTVLTIAHRLNTIMDSTRVMVLDKGSIKEFASPSELLQDKQSIFYSMARDAGLVKDT